MTMRSSALTWLALLAACSGDKDTAGTGGGGTGGTTGNQAPIADAGSDVSQETADTVSLDGRGSYDPEGDTITFHWSFDRVPDGSAIESAASPFSVNNGTENSTSFHPDAIGTYVVALVVEDEEGKRSLPDYVIVSISDAEKPIANAGIDLSGAVGDSFSLDGGSSYDAAGRTLSYAWTLASAPAGSTATLGGADAATSTITVDKAGLYIASLVVNNGLSTSDPDTALITVSSSDPNPPTANAGADINGYDCSYTALNGSGSYDPNEEDTLTYLWSILTKPSGSTATESSAFSDRSTMSPTFYADIAGTYELALSVFDGSSWSAADTVTLTIAERTYNSEPAVEAGSDQAVDAGSAECAESGYTYDCDDCTNQVITLGAEATTSDGDSDPYTIKWEVLAGEATIADDDKLTTTATLEDITPTEPGACESLEYVFSLSATDCTGEAGADTVSVVVSCCGTEATSSAMRRPAAPAKK